jgi:hypothetical protein
MMGAQLVAATFANWRKLNDRPFRLLAHMALTCLDDAKKPTYYGGRDQMAWAIGAEPNAAGWQAAHRCIAELVKSGAIERVLYGHSGKRSEYVLNVGRRAGKGVTESIPNPEAQGVTQSIAKGVTQSTERVSLSDPIGCHSVTPLGTTDEATEEHKRNKGSGSEGEYRRARVARAQQPRISPIDEFLARRAGTA